MENLKNFTWRWQ